MKIHPISQTLLIIGMALFSGVLKAAPTSIVTSSGVTIPGSTGGGTTGTFVVPDAGTIVKQSNLVESFNSLGIAAGDTAQFVGSGGGHPIGTNIQNVIASVLNNPLNNGTVIGGKLQVIPGGDFAANVNFFLINPKGITLNGGAQVVVPGDFVVSTANYFVLQDATKVQLDGTSSGGSLTMSPVASFGFLAGQTPAPINVFGNVNFNVGSLQFVGGNFTAAADATGSPTLSSSSTLSIFSGAASSVNQTVPYLKGAATYSGVASSGGTVTLSGAHLSTTGKGGHLVIRGGQLVAQNSGTTATSIAATQGADLNLQADSSMSLTGGTTISSTSTAAGVNAGNVAIAAGDFGLASGSTISTDGTSNITVAATGNVTDAGTISAAGTATATATGGTVAVTGANVHLTSTAVVNVSGNAGGGTAKIGGGAHGTDTTIANAQATTIDPGAQIIADALRTGNGGKVVVWSNNDTEFYGNINAQGGAVSGNGGNVEVSGGYLNFQGKVNTLAAYDEAGDLLLDPTDVLIEMAGTQDTAYTGDGNGPFTGGTGSPSVLLVGTLQTALAAGNVTVNTTGSGATDGGSITVANNVAWTSGSSLTLTTSALVLNANLANTTTPGGTTPGTGSVILKNSGLVSGPGTITAGTLALNGSGNVGASGGAINTAVNTITIAPTGNSGNIYLSQSGAVSISGTMIDTSADNLALTSTGGITVSALLKNNTGAGSTMSLTGIALALTGNLSDPSGSITINNSGAATGSGSVTAATVSLNNSGAYSGTGTITATTLNLQGSGNVGATGAGNSINTDVSTLGLATTGGNTYLAQTGALSVSGTTQGLFNLNDTAGITVSSTGLTNGSGAGSMTNLTGTTLTLTGNLSDTGGAITLANSGTASGAGTIHAATVTLNNSGAYSGTGTITATTLNLNGSGDVGATGAGNAINTAVSALSVGTTAGDIFLSQTGAATLSGTSAGNFSLNGTAGITVAAAGFSNSSGPGGMTNLTGTTLTLTGNLSDAGGTLTLNNTGAVTGSGAVNAGTVTLNNSSNYSGTGTLTATTLNLNGSGNIGATGAGNAINTAVSTLGINTTGGNTYLAQSGDVSVSGATQGTFNLTDTAGITIGAANLTNSTGAGSSINLAGTTLTLTGNLGDNLGTIKLANSGMASGAGTVTAGTVLLTNSGTYAGSGAITATTLELENPGDVGTSATAVTTSVGTVQLAYDTGNVYLTQAGTGTLNVQGIGVNAGGTGTTVSLTGTGGLSLTIAGTVDLASNVDGIFNFAGGTITGQGGSTYDVNFGTTRGNGLGTGTVELAAGTGIVTFQDTGSGGVTVAASNATSGDINITSNGGSTGTTISAGTVVTTLSNVNGAYNIKGANGSPLSVQSGVTASAISLVTTGGVTIGGSSTVNATSGNLGVNSGTLNVGSGSKLKESGTGTLIIATTGTVGVSGTITTSAPDSGSSALQLNASALTVSGGTISSSGSGTIAIGGAGALPVTMTGAGTIGNTGTTGGNVTLTTFSSSTYGLSLAGTSKIEDLGSAGTITLKDTSTAGIRIAGTSSTLASAITTNASGGIILTADNLNLASNGEIVTTASTGQGGSITITLGTLGVFPTLDIDGTNSGIYTKVTGTGAPGGISIEGAVNSPEFYYSTNVNLTNGGQISSDGGLTLDGQNLYVDDKSSIFSTQLLYSVFLGIIDLDEGASITTGNSNNSGINMYAGTLVTGDTGGSYLANQSNSSIPVNSQANVATTLTDGEVDSYYGFYPLYDPATYDDISGPSNAGLSSGPEVYVASVDGASGLSASAGSPTPTYSLVLDGSLLTPGLQPDNLVSGSDQIINELGSSGDYTYTIDPSDGVLSGRNLFLSFSYFNAAHGEIVVFSPTYTLPSTQTVTVPLQNVVVRITGGATTFSGGFDMSAVANANFYFLNPAGFMFKSRTGSGLSVGNDTTLTFSTANSITLGSNTTFYSYIGNTDPSNSSSFSEPVTSLNFDTDQGPEPTAPTLSSGTITISGAIFGTSNYSPAADLGALQLVGGNITIKNSSFISADNVNIVATAPQVAPQTGDTSIRLNNMGMVTASTANITTSNASQLGTLTIDGGSILASASDGPATMFYAANTFTLNDAFIIDQTTGTIASSLPTPIIIVANNAAIFSSGQGSTFITTANLGNPHGYTGASITVDANNLAIYSVDPPSSTELLGIFSQAEPLEAFNNSTRLYGPAIATGDSGNAGNITLNITNNLFLTGNGQISAASYGTGTSGNISIGTAGTPTASINVGGTYTYNGGANTAGGLGFITSSTSVSSIDETVVTPSSGNAGNLAINAGTLSIDGSATDPANTTVTLSSTLSSSTGGVGAGGNIVLNLSGSLSITNGGQINVSSNGTTGVPGTISIGSAAAPVPTVTVDGINTDGSTSGILANADGSSSAAQGLNSSANAAITIYSGSVTLSNYGVISTDSEGYQNAGGITINCGSLTITGGTLVGANNTNFSTALNSGIYSQNDATIFSYSGPGYNYSYVNSNFDPSANASAGSIVLNATHSIVVQAGGQINATSYGVGSTGTIDIGSAQSPVPILTVDGFASGIFAQAEGEVPTPGLNPEYTAISIFSGSLTVSDFGLISTDSFGYQNAGDINITSNTITITGMDALPVNSSSNGLNSGIYSQNDADTIFGQYTSTIGATTSFFAYAYLETNSFNTNTTASGANIKLNAASSLSITAGGQVNATSYGTGSTGIITVGSAMTPVPTVTIDGFNSGILAQSEGNMPGPMTGGAPQTAITVYAGALTLSNYGLISTDSFGYQAAGGIVISSNSTTITGANSLPSNAVNADSGLNSGIYSQDDGFTQISTYTTVDGMGNTINNVYDYLVTNSDATAMAPGGTVSLTTGNLTVTALGQINCQTYGAGNGGNININVAGNSAVTGAVGDVAVESGGLITAGSTSTSTGAAGSVTINQSNSLDAATNTHAGVWIDGVNTATNTSSGISTLAGAGSSSMVAAANAPAGSGNLTINAQALYVTNGGTVNASTAGNYAGGEINIFYDAANQYGSATPQPDPGSNAAYYAQHLIPTVQVLGGGQITSNSNGGIGGGGSIFINTGSMKVSGSTLIAGITTNSEIASNSSGTSAAATGGNITINVNGNMTISGNGELTASTSGGGAGGNITLNVNGGMTISGNGELTASTSGSGAGGTIDLTVNGVSGMTGTGDLTITSGGTITASTSGSGAGGTIDLTVTGVSGTTGTGDLAVTSGGTITASSVNGTGDAGSIIITQSGSSDITAPTQNTTTNGGLFLNDGSITTAALGLGESTATTTNPGFITLNVQALTEVNGSQVNASTSGLSTAGNISIYGPGGAATPTQFVYVTGGSSIASQSLNNVNGAGVNGTPGNGGDITVDAGALTLAGGTGVTKLWTDSETVQGGTAGGNAGTINLTIAMQNKIGATGNIIINNGASISSSSSTTGGAGRVNILAANDVLIDGTGSGISTNAGAYGSAGSQGGDITIENAQNLTVSDGASISATTGGFLPGTTTYGPGASPGGTINIYLPGVLTLTGSSTIDASSTALAGGGDGGSINIGATTDPSLGLRAAANTAVSPSAINISNNSNITAGALATSGGDITIFVGNINIQNYSSIETEGNGPSNSGGSISINAGTLFYLNHYSDISTHSGGQGGNITIDPNFVIVDHSFIDAFGGLGDGNVVLLANYTLSGDSSITASGTVTIESFPLDLSGSLVGLPADLTDEAKRLRESCARAVNHEFSSLIVVGRSGTETAPDELNSDSGSSDGGADRNSAVQSHEKLR